ncbi:LOG family protein [bacterium]|nr:LOG family protein [bacterium]
MTDLPEIPDEVDQTTVSEASAEDVAEQEALRQQRKERRKHLDERLRSLHQRALVIEKQLHELRDGRFYRTCIFGSARIKPDNVEYQEVFSLARMLAWEGIDILTGGGPGLMEAANKGAKLGQQEKQSKSMSFGLSIQLEFEPEPNSHLDVKRHHHKFSSRLDDFMRLSDSVIATPGGIGTVLELFFAWQLIQVKHLPPRPIVLMDKSFWCGMIEWMKEVVLARGLVSAKDFDVITIVDTPEEVFQVISEHHKLVAKDAQQAAGK